MSKNKHKVVKKIVPNSLRRERKRRHFKLKEVALLTGAKSSSNLSHLESGRKLPTLVTTLKLAAVFGFKACQTI